MNTTCPICGATFDPVKDFFITINERKGPAIDFDRLECATTYMENE